MGNQSDFDLTRGDAEEPEKASVFQIRERVRPASPHVEREHRDPVQDWDTRNAASLQIPAPDQTHVTSPTATRERTDAFSLEATPDPADKTYHDDPEHRRQHIGRGEDHASGKARRVTSMDRRPAHQTHSAPQRTLGGFALAGLAAIAIGVVATLPGHNARHTGTSARAKAAASIEAISQPTYIAATLAHEASTTITSIGADGAKAAKARAAAQAQARTRAAARKARAKRAARARAARARRRHQAAARANHPQQSLSTQAPTASASTTPTSASSTPTQSSNPASHATSSPSAPARHPYGVGGLLSIGSSPSG